jgi:hypothetical protein
LDLFEARVFGWRFDFSSFSGGVTANASMAFSNDSGCSEIGFDLGRGCAALFLRAMIEPLDLWFRAVIVVPDVFG